MRGGFSVELFVPLPYPECFANLTQQSKWGGVLKRLSAAFLCMALAGCSHSVEPASVAAFTAVTSYSERLPGKYLYYAEQSELKRDIKPSDFNCSFHTYPIDLTGTLANSARRTLAGYVEELEQVSSPVPIKDLRSHGARGIIIIRGEDLNARVRVVPGFWEASMEADVDVTASVQVDGRNGRLVGQTVEGDGDARTSAGFTCEGGADALSQAAEKAMRETVRKLAEAVANSERLRAAAGS